jgi:hypothetical protein
MRLVGCALHVYVAVHARLARWRHSLQIAARVDRAPWASRTARAWGLEHSVLQKKANEFMHVFTRDENTLHSS